MASENGVNYKLSAKLNGVETGAIEASGSRPNQGNSVGNGGEPPVPNMEAVETVSSGNLPDRSSRAPRAFKAAIKQTEKGFRNWGSPQDPIWKEYPFLAEWMFLRTLDNIRYREVSTFSFSATPSGCTITLNDYYLGKKLPVKADTLWGCLDELERLLDDPDAPWIELDKGRGAERRKGYERKKLDERGMKYEDVV